MKIRYFLVVMTFLMLYPATGGSESCTGCHTDESIMRSLVEMPEPKGNASRGAIGPAGPPSAIKPETYYKRYYVEKAVLDKDPHFAGGCVPCHKGNSKAMDKDEAHKGVLRRPSADPKTCADCHDDIARSYRNSLHYTLRGFVTKTSRRLSAKEEKVFTEKVFGQSCRSCHATCGDCHVSSPAIDGIRAGFIKGHAFVKKDEAKTCAVCHGARVYQEFTGKHAGPPDVHYQKNMACLQCHKKTHLHGDGNVYNSKDEVRGTPACRDCHKTGAEKNPVAKLAHSKHDGRVTCYGCHVDGVYR
ncbi:MAG: multiheme c-type cytochrome, partial [Syntrophaceae bacterium]